MRIIDVEEDARNRLWDSLREVVEQGLAFMLAQRSLLAALFVFQRGYGGYRRPGRTIGYPFFFQLPVGCLVVRGSYICALLFVLRSIHWLNHFANDESQQSNGKCNGLDPRWDT